MEEGLEEMKMHLASFIVNPKEYKEERVVGTGAYGKVYLAINVKNNQKYAIKELFIDHLEGRQLKLFCREVQILAKCQNLFLLPFHGFTLTHPYSIVTEFVPNGSLYEALRHRPKSPTLTPTNKTVIAMAIAHGMMHLHELNIIHRDLKSLNILLDEDLYPKICDFGIARFVGDQNQIITQQIGTPHWMAPELFQGGQYDMRVDVYAYGIILWEMLSEDTPFKGRCPVQIMNAVCTLHERPIMPIGVPKELDELVRLCWAQTPEERPTFKMIYKMFKEKKLAFAGTDFSAVDECVRRIEKAQEEVRMKKWSDFPRVADMELVDVPELICSSPEPKPQVSKTGVDLLDELAKMPGEKMEDVVKMLRAVINKDESMIDAVKQHEVFEKIPFGDHSLFGVVYDLVFDMLEKNPGSVPAEKIKQVIDANAQHSRELMSLLTLMPRDDRVAELVMKNWRLFVTKDAGVLLMTVVNDLLCGSFIGKYEQEYAEMIKKAFEMTNRRVLNASYRVLANHFDEKYVSPLLGKHLGMKGVGHPALLVLSQCANVVLTEQHFIALFNLARYKEANQIIRKGAQNPEYAQIIASNSAFWLGTDKLDSQTCLMVIYELTKHKDIKFSDATLLKFCWFLDKCLSIEPIPFGTICMILREMPKDETVATYCESSGFSQKFLKAAIDQHEYQTAVRFVRTLLKFGVSESFKLLLEKISSIDIETDMSSIPLVCSVDSKYLPHTGDENVVVNAIKTANT